MEINKEAKFNIGDAVYYVKKSDNNVVLSRIWTIIFNKESIISYGLQEGIIRTENELFATQEEAEEKAKRGRVKVYLSGAIANDKNYVSKFMTAKEEVKKMGFSVLSPIETSESLHDKGAKECMFASIELLKKADVMLLLDKDLTKSKGVQIEIELARYCNIPVADKYKDIEYFYKRGKGEK